MPLLTPCTPRFARPLLGQFGCAWLACLALLFGQAAALWHTSAHGLELGLGQQHVQAQLGSLGLDQAQEDAEAQAHCALCLAACAGAWMAGGDQGWAHRWAASHQSWSIQSPNKRIQGDDSNHQPIRGPPWAQASVKRLSA